MNRVALAIASVAALVGLGVGVALGRGTAAPVGSVASDQLGPVQRIVGLRSETAPRAKPLKAEGFAFERLRLDFSGDGPKACVEFSEDLAPAAQVRYGDYLRIEPAARPTVEVVGNALCLTGLGFEPDRDLTLLAGLPAKSGAKLAENQFVKLAFGEQPPFVGFAGAGVILPREEADGLGIETVNVSKLFVEVRRVPDRILSQREIIEGMNRSQGEYYYVDDGSDVGEKVFEGKIDVAAGDKDRNRRVVTVFPLGAAVKTLKPGAYVVSARDASSGKSDDYEAAQATRWIIHTDLALSTFQGSDGLDAIVRSLRSAKPLVGVEVALIAANNDELGRARTDAQGRARFPAPMLKGEGALEPRMVMAYARNGDFAALDLRRPGIDLSDRGVDGRLPGPLVDTYAWLDRGIYRPGETVRFAAMMRDPAGRAVRERAGAIVVLRPNGTEAMRVRFANSPDGVVQKDIAVPRSAPRGVWRARVEVDGVGDSGGADFSVEDFVPQRLAVEAKVAPAPMRLGEVRPVDVSARFLYGAPGAGLATEGEARLKLDPAPFPDLKDFVFGREDEDFSERIIAMEPGMTDGAGRAAMALNLSDAPQSSRPLRADVVVGVSEPGGRVVRESVRVPVRGADIYLGVRPKFSGGRAPEGQEAAFELAAVGADGRRIAAPGVEITLVEEDYGYDWYLEDGQWRWRRTGRDIPRDRKLVDVAANGVAAYSTRLKWGSYRLIAKDTAGRAQTSYRFSVGWAAPDAAPDSPDAVEVSLMGAGKPVRPGGVARLAIRAPYPGEATVAIATDKVHIIRNVQIGAKGGTVDIPTDSAWGGGAYALVTVITPRTPDKRPIPRRAIGAVYIPLDRSDRTLTVALENTPKVIRPRQAVSIPVRVTGAGPGERVRVTLAAVDEGILRLTKFASPDPKEHYFGRRALGVQLRDDYGRLLDPNLGAPTKVGGDSIGGEGLTVVPTKSVALYSGVVELRGGRGVITFEPTDFNGELRLMAVAFSPSGMGSTAQAVTMRDPAPAELSLSRFLAPGDQAVATLSLDNVEAEPGPFTVTVTGEGPVRATAPAQRFTLARGERIAASFPIQATGLGVGAVKLSVQGPGGFSVTRSYPIQSRPAALATTLVETTAQPAGATYTADAGLLNGFLPGSGSVTVSYSALRGVDPGPLYDSLSTYPYGCSEQVASVALPLLYADTLRDAIGAKDPKVFAGRVQDAVNQLLDRQDADGAFGLWRVGDRNASPWLGAYVTDFVLRARKAGYAVPDAAVAKALDVMVAIAKQERYLSAGYDADVYESAWNNDTKDLLRSRAAAYALYLLAREGRGDIGKLRYFHDARLKAEPSPLARAQVGAGLAFMGDRARARSAFKAALEAIGYENTGDYYQTPTRDAAAVLALATEAGLPEEARAAAVQLERFAPQSRYFQTQEQAQMLLAFNAVQATIGKLAVARDGQVADGAAPAWRLTAAELQRGSAFMNRSRDSIWRTVARTGSPTGVAPGAQRGFAISKTYLTMGGGAANLAALRQGDRLIVVLSGAAEQNRLHPAVLVDLLPAGFEIETILRPEDGMGYADEWGETRRSGPYAFVGEITRPNIAEARDDRFVAALDLVNGRGFTLAYVVRAVTPGRFANAGAQIEDMYRPGVMGRSPPGVVAIASAR